MPKLGFSEALDQVIASHPQFDREAYLFLRDALDFTIKSRKKQKSELSRHVTGQELMEGVRLYALQEFGPMVPTVFETWNIRECGDVGQMVFNLIQGGIFDKTENDSMDDFKGAYAFHDAFVKPYLPEKPFVTFRPATPKLLIKEAEPTVEAPAQAAKSPKARKTTKVKPAKDAKATTTKAKKPKTVTKSEG